MLSPCAGVLGDNVKISKDKSKITVVTELAFSKRCAGALLLLTPQLHIHP